MDQAGATLKVITRPGVGVDNIGIVDKATWVQLTAAATALEVVVPDRVDLAG